MRISESCAKCMYDHQRSRVQDPDYLEEIRALIEERGEKDTSPLLNYRFKQVFNCYFGTADRYAEVKVRYNDLVLGMEEGLRSRIESAPDPLAAALAFARIGNYIDYGALDTVDEETFLALFDGAVLREEETGVYESFLKACGRGRSFLLIADNCGEIVLDRLFLEQLKKRFPLLRLRVMVRGGEVLNDVTAADAVYAGIDRVAEIIFSGAAVAGTVCDMLAPDARRALDEADVILAKGQGNYESLSDQGRHIFYVFLCKCDLFTGRFHVPRFTGMLVEEKPED